MKFRVLLDLESWASLTTKVSTNNQYNFSSIEFAGQIPAINFTRLIIEWNNNNSYYEFKVYNQNTLIGTYHGIEVLQNIGDLLLIDCNVSFTFYEDAILLENKFCVDLGKDFDGVTNILTYKLNDQNDALNKKLTVIGSITGNFKAPLSIKNVEIDVLNFNPISSFNYVYIPKLKRYYYVTNIQMINKEYTRLILQEDVLMSWQVLIKSQSAYVTRYENSTEDELFDDRLPLEDIITTDNVTSTAVDTTSGSLVNVTLDFNNYYHGSGTYPNIMVISQSTKVQAGAYNSYYIGSPSGSGLPDISAQLNDLEYMSFITPEKFFYLQNAYMSEDSISSYIESVIRLPFNPTTAFQLSTESYYAIQVRDKFIDQYGNYVPYNSPTDTPLQTYRGLLNAGARATCPYFIIKDFTYTINAKPIDYEPYSNYEFFIPFVGWVKVEARKFFNKRILIYYSMDVKTGMATAYIYNYTNKYVIWSGSCQLGHKIDMTTTNQTENIRQRQANDLNMLLGLVSSAVSVGIGVYANNPVAVTGGVLTAYKTIASNVNSNNQIFERAQISFGSGNACYYAPKEFTINRSYHKKKVGSDDLFKHMQGLPYNKYTSISLMTGYVEIGEIHFDAGSESIYQVEIDEIVSLLKNGVIM